MQAELIKLLGMAIYGNAYHDQPLFTLAHEIIMSEAATMSQKRAALRRVDEAMGTEQNTDEDAVREYIAAFHDSA